MKFQSTSVHLIVLCQNLRLHQQGFKLSLSFMKVREILAEYDPQFMPMGLDEAYLNITEHLEERLNWPEDKRRFCFRTESTAEKGMQNTLCSCI